MLWRVMLGGLRVKPSLAATVGRGFTPCTPTASLTPMMPITPLVIPTRRSGHYIPPTQYDIPISRKFQLSYSLVVYWEIIPLFVTTCISILILIVAIAWASKNKVDVVYSTHSCNNISRTMNLRRPTCHKMVTINQRYEPWPEMQDVIDKLAVAERRVLLKATQCTYEQREGHPPPES